MSFRQPRDTSTLAARRLAALAADFGRAAAEAGRDEQPALAAGRVRLERPGVAPGRHAARSTGRGSRLFWLSSQHLTIVAITVAAVCILAGWQVLRSVPDAQPVELSSGRIEPTADQADSANPAAGTLSASPPTESVPADPASGALIIVDVTGKVRRPGIVELPPGSRVVDALEAAGGARPAADTSTLNLARVLVDGEQIVVGTVTRGTGPMSGPTSPVETGTAIAAVNLNTATAEQLETLPGVGPVTAAAILEWRSQHGAFSSVEELLEVSGIGEATLGELKPYVHV